MPTLNMSDQMTALEIVKRANAPDPFKIIEIMGLTNEFLLDVPAYEANSGVVNKTLQRSTVPLGEHRIYNRGVGRVATQTDIVTDRVAHLGAYSDVDASMLEHSGNKNASRSSEAVGILKGMGLTQAQTIVYGDGDKADEFAGLMYRLNKIGRNVINAGGTGSSLTSIYLCAVGLDLFHLIYPKGSRTVGVEREDRGLLDVPDPADAKKMYPVYREYFTAQYGITVRDPDSVKRIANIAGNINVDDLIDLIIDARLRLPQGASTYVLYANLDIHSKLDKAARDRGNVIYSATDPWGRPITQVRDMRIRRMDVIENTEEQVA